MKIRLVKGAKDLAAFIDLPYRLHRADPGWVPPLRFDVRARLNRKKNPFFEHGDADYFLAERGGEVVGRIAAISNRLHNETHDDATAFFGFFESVNDPLVSRALFDMAAQWARERGFDVLRGPASFSTNDECGLLVEGFEGPATMMMAHNPPYYVDLLESAGFVKAKDLWAYASDLGEVPERIRRAGRAICRRAGVTVRRADPKRFQSEIASLKQGYNDYWESNWGFVPMTDRELNHMAGQLKPLFDPRMVLFAEKEGKVVAVLLALPDVNELLGSNRSGRLFPAVLRVLWRLRRKQVSRMRLLMLGVLPEFRGKGVDAVLINDLWAHVIARGIDWCEAGWILEDNPAMSNATERLGFTRYKTYRLYDRAL
jgi:GNAT superfamily N-acetyltransferase